MAIRHKRKATTGYTWLNTDLVDGQVGINTADGTLHVLKTDNTVQTIQTGLQNIVEDLTPELGGPLHTLDNDIDITDGAGVIEGAIGKSPDGVYIAYTGADGIYTDTDGGVNLIPGTVELHGTTVEVQSLIGTGSRQVYCSPDGHLYSVLPPAPGWVETDFDNGDYQLDTLGVWVEISGLEITFPQDTPAGDRLDFSVNLHVINNTTRGGSIDISAGKNGAIPLTNGVNVRIEEGFDNTIPVSISLTNHVGYLTGDTSTVWVRIASEDHSAFDPEVHGSSGATHELTVGVPGEGGSGGDAIWGAITGTLSDQNDLITALNLKANQSDLTITNNNVSTNTTNISTNATNITLKEDLLGDPSTDDFVLSSLADGTRSWVDVNTLTSGGGSDSYFSGHNGTTVQTFSTPITLFFGTIIRQDSDFTHNNVAGGSEVTVNTTGWYYLNYVTSLTGASNNSTVSLITLELNGAELLGGASASYHKSRNDGEGTAGNNILANLTAGDVIRVRADSRDLKDISSIINSCTLNFKYLGT